MQVLLVPCLKIAPHCNIAVWSARRILPTPRKERVQNQAYCLVPALTQQRARHNSDVRVGGYWRAAASTGQACSRLERREATRVQVRAAAQEGTLALSSPTPGKAHQSQEPSAGPSFQRSNTRVQSKTGLPSIWLTSLWILQSQELSSVADPTCAGVSSRVHPHDCCGDSNPVF